MTVVTSSKFSNRSLSLNEIERGRGTGSGIEGSYSRSLWSFTAFCMMLMLCLRYFLVVQMISDSSSSLLVTLRFSRSELWDIENSEVCWEPPNWSLCSSCTG